VVSYELHATLRINFCRTSREIF